MAQRATSLGHKPSLFALVCFVYFFAFVSFLFLEKTVPPPKGHFSFSVSPKASLVFFTPPLFTLSFSVSLLFLSFFLPSFFSFFLAFFCFLVFCLCNYLPCFFFCFCFMKRRTTTKYQIRKLFFINAFCFLVSCLLLSFKSIFSLF